jgi:GTP-binding protein LepA
MKSPGPIAACEGALLLVDSTQGIQAQTISNLYLAIEHNLEIIPVLNKIDMPNAMIEEVSDQIIDLVGIPKSDILLASGKTVKVSTKSWKPLSNIFPLRQAIRKHLCRL